MTKAEPRITALIAKPDHVVSAPFENLTQALSGQTGGVYGLITAAREAYVLVDDAGDMAPGQWTASRWTVNVMDGALVVSAWRDEQDRASDDPETILLLAQGAWTEFSKHLRQVEEDIEQGEEP